MVRYYNSHTTDSVLGRTGTTLDWPKSVPDFEPEDWNNYVNQPPRGTSWRDHLRATNHIVARNAVRPFALYYEPNCNLILIAEELFEAIEDWCHTLEGVEDGVVSFGKKSRTYSFASLKYTNVLDEAHFSPNSRFSRFATDKYYMHGTRVQRGEESTEQMPEPLDENLSFSSTEELRNGWVNLTRLVPQHIEFVADRLPLLFAAGLDLFAAEPVVKEISNYPQPGISFPFRAISAAISTPTGNR